jgi:hypothetical protein
LNLLGELCGLFFPTFAVKRLFRLLAARAKDLNRKSSRRKSRKDREEFILGHYRSAHGLAFSLKSSHDGGSYFDQRCADKSMRTSDDS